MIYLQRYAETGKIGKEESSVLNHAIVNGLPYRFLDEALIGCQENYPDLSLFVGSVEACRVVLSRMGHLLPSPNYYPNELSQFLGREVWLGTKTNVIASMAQGVSVFAKPAMKWKLFTGQVFDESSGFSIINEVSNDERLWLSDVVGFKSEFRAYVADRELIAVSQYAGEDDADADLDTIKMAVDQFGNNPANPSTYAFDWGYTEDGSFLLIEVNHCFAIGRYAGISDREYYRFLEGGWNNLTSESV
ncbi:ATP-grasp domain-containing protein [Vibrio coralliirubri]|uniref:ATP-grasp domain-containing protein n=1 Tax=Vibrio coralliirubri TaxID=1516159 RepID=UPI002284E3A1|nr:ATP-grasp domain-containing protein [Vibrio coralliirubri]MCY9861226.1 ATP-grasp domain-containing protein [Vibrio coralliirubri]